MLETSTPSVARHGIDHRVQGPAPDRRLVEDVDEVLPAERARPEMRRERLAVRHQRGQRDEHERREERDRRHDQQASGSRRPAGTGAAARSPAASAASAWPRRATVVALTLRGSHVVHPAAGVADDEDGDGERDDEQHHRHRRRVAHVEVAEPVLVEQHGIEERRGLGIAEVVDGLVTRLRRLARRDVGRDVGLREVLQARR